MLPDQGEPTDKAFLLQLQEASCSQALVLLGDFNHPDICGKSSMVSCRQSRRLHRSPWEPVSRDKGAEQIWQIFKDTFHTAQELLIPRGKKSEKESKRPAWLSPYLLVELKVKKEMHRQWKQVQVSWEEHRDAARLYKDGVRRAKVQLELNLARDAKNSKKGFYRYISQKRKVKESVLPLMKNNSNLVSTEEKVAEVLNNLSASFFTGNLSSHTSRVDGPQDGNWEGKAPPTVNKIRFVTI